MVQEPSISFILGAGFSKPAGYPLASEINSRLRQLKASDISIHSDGRAWFHHGEPRRNDWFTKEKERKFAERLLAYYSHSKAHVGDFAYERFYDWCKELSESGCADVELEKIAIGLGDSLVNHLLNFEITFNNLLVSELSSSHERQIANSGSLGCYTRFFELVKRLGQCSTLHFHTLNHDLLFERLSRLDDLGGRVADGFSDVGSPYYGRLECDLPSSHGGGRISGHVRLPRFDNEFGAHYNLYKLHGSIDQYVDHTCAQETVKVLPGVELSGVQREVGCGSEVRYEPFFLDAYPKFLSGVRFKRSQYSVTPYSRSIFKHFEDNLASAGSLITIGYGFGDEGVNEIIRRCYLRRPESKIFRVDIAGSRIANEICEACEFFEGGVGDFELERLLASIAALSS